MSTLQLSKAVLSLLHKNQREALFIAEDDELTDWFRWVLIDRATYEDMGSPEVISVTIEPGDKLNG